MKLFALKYSLKGSEMTKVLFAIKSFFNLAIVIGYV